MAFESRLNKVHDAFLHFLFAGRWCIMYHQEATGEGEGLDGGKVPIGASGFPGTDCSPPAIGADTSASSEPAADTEAPATETATPAAESAGKRALGPTQVSLCSFVSLPRE